MCIRDRAEPVLKRPSAAPASDAKEKEKPEGEERNEEVKAPMKRPSAARAEGHPFFFCCLLLLRAKFGSGRDGDQSVESILDQKLAEVGVEDQWI